MRALVVFVVVAARASGRSADYLPRDAAPDVFRLIRKAAPFTAAERAVARAAPGRAARCAARLVDEDVFDETACGAPTPEPCVVAATLTAVVPHRGLGDRTARCAAAVLSALAPFCASEVVLVRDGPTDARLDAFLARAANRWPRTTIVAASSGGDGRGYAAAATAGVAVATGEYVLLLNNDVVLLAPAARVLADSFRSRASAGAVARVPTRDAIVFDVPSTCLGYDRTPRS